MLWQMALVCTFLWLNSISLYIYIYIYIYIYHIFFIHSSVDRHLGCVHELAIVNSATVNEGIHVSFWFIILFGYMPRNGMAGSYGNYIFLFSKESLWEKAMATHSNTLSWKIPWTEEPGRSQSMGSLRVRHDWMTSLSLFTFMHSRRKWQPTPVFLSGESQGRESLVGCRLQGCTESDTTEAT